MVKQSHIILLSTLPLLFTSCSKANSDKGVVSQKYIHKYGFEVAKTEWEDRQAEGKIITKTEEGITLSQSYENGLLHGESTYSFPNSPHMERKLVYEKGMLLKEIVYDEQGIPIRESDYAIEDRTINTCWDSQGVPLSIEELSDDQLLEGKYFDQLHNEEASVSGGNGLKIKRDRNHVLLHKEEISNGNVITRYCYFPNGQLQSTTFFQGGEPDGIQKKYTETGLPLVEISWAQGVLDGPRIQYKNGKKYCEVLYKNGEKEGFEVFYNQDNSHLAEIQWKSGKKHGSSRYYADNQTRIEWYFEDQLVTRNQFESLEMRREAIADLTGLFSSSSESK